ncbi:MAG TPA: ABC transporter permease [Vicinamibacterales bacterium]|nr:ABC transporter permease [Vicinamibacterales bacterium]
MRWAVIRSLIAGLLRRDRVELDLADEVEFHLDARVRDLMRRGLSPAEARRRARLEFGSVERYKEDVRRARGLRLSDELRSDLLYGWRSLRRAPGFTFIAALSLALGIGANTLVFSLLDSTLLRPLNLPDSDRLVAIWTVPAENPDQLGTSSIQRFVALRDRTQSFEAIGAFNGIACGVKTLGFDRDGVAAERILGQTVSPTMFQALGVEPLMGRAFTEAEDIVDQVSPVILLSHRSWVRRFESDAAIVGKTVTLDRVPTTVIGVLPSSFDFFGNDREFLAPLCLTRAQVDSRVGGNSIVGRLKRGVPIERARAEIETLAASLAMIDPARHAGLSFRMESLKRSQARLLDGIGQPSGDYATSLMTLQGAVGFVLLIACANVAGLLLARGTGRQHEIALRMTLGAGRARIIRQVLTESLPLTLLGASLAVLIAWLGLKLLVSTAPSGIPRLDQVSLDLRLLSFTAAVALLTSLIFAIVPALHVSRITSGASFGPSQRTTWSAQHQRVRSVLVSGQVALALVLLVGAGLMIHSFVRVLENELGADPRNLLTFDFRLPSRESFRAVGAYRGLGLFEVSPVPAQTVERVFDRLQNVPGVVAVAAVSSPPFVGPSVEMPIVIEGRPLPPTVTAGAPPNEQQTADYFAITPGFFKVMGIPVRRGRDFDSHDRADAAPVVIISETMSRQFFPNEDPVGQSMRFDFVPNERPRQIVGIVGDTLAGPLETSHRPAIYVPHVQQGATFVGPLVYLRIGMTFVLRTAGSPMSVLAEVKRAVAEVDRTTPVASPRTVEQTLDGHLERLRLSMWLLGVFGAVAALLAGTGIYGVIAYSVAQRTREFGLRMALGASASSVFTMVFRYATRIVVSGLGLGLAAAFLLSGVLQASLFQVTRTDPATYVSVAVLLMVIAALACLIPVRRATSVSPTVALRHD